MFHETLSMFFNDWWKTINGDENHSFREYVRKPEDVLFTDSGTSYPVNSSCDVLSSSSPYQQRKQRWNIMACGTFEDSSFTVKVTVE